MTQYSDLMNFPSVTADNMIFFIIISTKLKMTDNSFQPADFAHKHLLMSLEDQ